MTSSTVTRSRFFAADVIASQPLDDLPQAFRAAMRRLASAVAIVAARGPDGPVGIAATSMTSLTLDPPAVLVCINQQATLHACLVAGARVSISLLSHHQREVSAAFGGAVPRSQRFEVGDWQDDAGLPALADAQANLCCTIDSLIPYGTHSIVIARVDTVRVSEAVAPLIYQDGAYL